MCINPSTKKIDQNFYKKENYIMTENNNNFQTEIPIVRPLVKLLCEWTEIDACSYCKQRGKKLQNTCEPLVKICEKCKSFRERYL